MDQLLDDFKGRILPSASLPEFNSVDTLVLEPADHDDDLVTALKLAAADNRRVLVRSGSQFKSKPSAEDVSGALVLRLAPLPFSAVLSQQTIQVSAVETLGTLADKAASADLFLPLDDADKLRSVVSYVLAKTPAFPCSSPQPVLLIDYIFSVHVVYTRDPKQQRDLSGEEFRRAVDAGPLPFVVTRLRFQSDGPGNERWLHCWVMVFERNAARQLLTELDGADALNGIDLTLRAQSGPFGISLILLRATGTGDEQQRQRLIDFIENVLQDTEFIKEFDSRGAKAIAQWMALSPVEAVPERLVTTTAVKSDSPRSLSDVSDPFVRAASFLVGLNPDGSDPSPGIQAWIMLRRSASVANAVDIDAQMLVDEMVASPEQVEEGRRLLKDLKGDEELQNGRISQIPKDFELTTQLETRSAGNGIIPGLKGDLFQPGTALYAVKAHQYATSSYDAATIAKRMSPLMIVVPKTESDVIAVVEYAAAHSFYVVTRSGGHQYCGMSSGGPDTVQLSMEDFDSVEIAGDGTATIGAGTPLFKLSSALFMAGVALPHGECPLVAVGGHIQTGGFGHLLRNLGLALDYVKAFKMVTAGADKKAVVRRYQRPEPGAKDDGVFAAVLGGGPGSWGVILSYEMEVVQNMPGTVGYSYYYLYNNELHDSKKALTTALYKLQEWNYRLVQGQLPPGQDLFVTFISGQLLRPSLILVEAAATTPEGANEIRQAVDEVSSVQPPIIGFGKRIDGDTTLSRIAHLGVRDLLVGMPHGRELFWPYKKSLHCTKKTFDKDFVDRFVDLVDRADKAPDTAAVVQTVIGGGKLSDPRQACNRMQRRDATCMIVFDIFYKPGDPEAEKHAISYQDEFNSMLKSFSDDDERMFWGSFENHDRGERDTDMSDPQVQSYYYNSTKDYQSLQEIKKKVDPLNIFHTQFTVQL